MEEEPNKPAQTTPLPTEIPDPNTPQNLPPQPSPSMEQPQPPQTTPPSQNPDPNTTRNPPNTNPPNPSQNLTPQPMEESETSQTTLPTQNPIPNPPNTTQNLPPPHLPPLPQKSNKRPLDQNGHIQNSKYFKMRAVLKDLRPHFIELNGEEEDDDDNVYGYGGTVSFADDLYLPCRFSFGGPRWRGYTVHTNNNDRHRSSSRSSYIQYCL